MTFPWRQSRRGNQILLDTGGKGKTAWAPGARGSGAGTWPQGLEEKRTDQERREYAEFRPLCRLTRVLNGSNFLAITRKIFTCCFWLPTCSSEFLFPAPFDQGSPSSSCDIWSLEEEAIGGNCWAITSCSSPVSIKGRELPHLSRGKSTGGTLQLLSAPHLLFPKSQEDGFIRVGSGARHEPPWLGASLFPHAQSQPVGNMHLFLYLYLCQGRLDFNQCCQWLVWTIRSQGCRKKPSSP